MGLKESFSNVPEEARELLLYHMRKIDNDLTACDNKALNFNYIRNSMRTELALMEKHLLGRTVGTQAAVLEETKDGAKGT